MNFKSTDIDHIATLARLSLTDLEKQEYSQQLATILDYFSTLKEVNAARKPFSHQSGLVNVLREDEVRLSLDKKELLKNAPASNDGFIKVKAVL